MTGDKTYETPCYLCYAFPASNCLNPDHRRVGTLAEHIAAFRPPPGSFACERCGTRFPIAKHRYNGVWAFPEGMTTIKRGKRKGEGPSLDKQRVIVCKACAGPRGGEETVPTDVPSVAY